MLRSIVQFTCLYMEGLSKILPQDVEMFRKVLEINDDFVEGFEDSYNSEKLSRKEVKMVTSLCLGMLEDEDVLRTSEVEVLRILTLISSRKEYVVYFRPEKEIQLILEEVERRILSDEVGTRLARQQAAKMFESILSTASDLRTSLTVIMPGTIKLVATWCKQVLESSDTGTFEEQVHLTGGVAALLVSNPEQAIAPLTRHGLGILALAKRRYGSKQIPNHVLHNYFLAHL